jgi:hypothetical protein
MNLKDLQLEAHTLATTKIQVYRLHIPFRRKTTVTKLLVLLTEDMTVRLVLEPARFPMQNLHRHGMRT